MSQQQRRQPGSSYGAVRAGKSRSVVAIACLAAGLCLAGRTLAQPRSERSALTYDAQTQGPVPIPPSERTLQTAVAESWLKVSNEGHVLEGAIFDRNNNLLFCDVTGHRVMRMAPDKKLSVVTTLDALSPHLLPGGLALSRDGRLFIAALDLSKSEGTIVAVQPDGTGMQTVIPPQAGYMPNDIVFDTNGGFYFSDSRGSSTNPRGGIYYVSPDGSTIQPVLRNLAMANGVALSPNGEYLWATEFSRNLLHRVTLATPTTIAPISSSIPYHFIGPAPDSVRVDADGNVYVAIYGQGRVMAFNRNGIPIGQVLLPGRDQGHNLLSTSIAISPDSKDLYVVTSDGSGGQGATLFHARAFSKGLPPASAR